VKAALLRRQQAMVKKLKETFEEQSEKPMSFNNAVDELARRTAGTQ